MPDIYGYKLGFRMHIQFILQYVLYSNQLSCTAGLNVGTDSKQQLQKGIGLFRSNSVGAQRMIAMSKLTGEPIDMTFGQSAAAGATTLGRNNTVSGGERSAARRNLLRRLGERVEKADAEQTSGTDDLSRPATPAATGQRRRKHRSHRRDSRASTVLDDRDDREQTSTTPNTPVVLPEPLAGLSQTAPGEAETPAGPSRTPALPELPSVVSMPLGGRGVVIEGEDEDVEQRLTEDMVIDEKKGTKRQRTCFPPN